ncbi:MAG: WXG100 family type VII secretion target [Pseudolysinimonas sp.]
MGELRVASEAVRGAGSRAQALMQEFVEALNGCDQVASGLLSESWSGPASAMFASGWAEWHRGAAEVHTALAGIARLLDESAAQYESTEATVTQVSTSSSVTVGGGKR